MAGKWNITGDDGFLAIIEKLERERNALRAEVEKLKADKARLDWINEHWDDCEFITKGDFSVDKLRDAIDSAMKGDK